jgi:hypothetical protein
MNKGFRFAVPLSMRLLCIVFNRQSPFLIALLVALAPRSACAAKSKSSAVRLRRAFAKPQ